MSDGNTQGLTLYEYFSCPFCMMTRRVIQQLGVEIDRRDILKNNHFKQELITGGGKSQVPCLRIESPEQVIWMYESRDIIHYLKQHFSN
ncbi:MAG: glutathione S-transferase N-terminal domain-containing protein [Gammaproteobacteria bacterium]|nr:glutathione S-transferase N-terminal domain-containing protein [Gammaproteobacteria bacterium]